jgi:hypothetical protein
MLFGARHRFLLEYESISCVASGESATNKIRPDPSGMPNLRQVLHLFVPAALRFFDLGDDFEGLF